MSDSHPFPLVELRAVADVNHDWVALSVRLAQPSDLARVFGTPDLLAAIAPLDCILFLHSPILDSTTLAMLARERLVLLVPTASLSDDAAAKAAIALQEAGYRVLLDGIPAEGAPPPATLRAVSSGCSDGVPAQHGKLLSLFGPHLAHGIDDAQLLDAATRAGFQWFSGDYALHPAPSNNHADDGTSRKRLLALLGLLARDADSRELEAQLKQDPALSYHLLRLVNSAAFALSTPINSFSQAIVLLGRRQLQRWLQLLLYARQQQTGPHNPLLPLAALRAAQMEMLCKQRGADRETQDLAFMTGVFSLLNVLLGMPMEDIVSTLSLPPAAAAALLAREGELGQLLRLSESGVDCVILEGAGVSPLAYWQSQLHAFHWAIQVSRNL